MISQLDDLQLRVGMWARRNFPSDLARLRLRIALGVCEEAGELAHAVLKRDQRFRGTDEEHQAAAMDAVGDVVVYLMNMCDCEGWSLAEIISDTVASVTKRDWVASPRDGVTP